jgi:hypothetical protein
MNKRSFWIATGSLSALTFGEDGGIGGDPAVGPVPGVGPDRGFSGIGAQPGIRTDGGNGTVGSGPGVTGFGSERRFSPQRGDGGLAPPSARGLVARLHSRGAAGRVN